MFTFYNLLLIFMRYLDYTVFFLHLLKKFT